MFFFIFPCPRPVTASASAMRRADGDRLFGRRRGFFFFSVRGFGRGDDGDSAAVKKKRQKGVEKKGRKNFSRRRFASRTTIMPTTMPTMAPPTTMTATTAPPTTMTATMTATVDRGSLFSFLSPHPLFVQCLSAVGRARAGIGVSFFFLGCCRFRLDGVGAVGPAEAEREVRDFFSRAGARVGQKKGRWSMPGSCDRRATCRLADGDEEESPERTGERERKDETGGVVVTMAVMV